MSVNSPIVDVACGSYATYAVDEQGHTWGWGLNNYGQLGIQGQVGPMWICPSLARLNQYTCWKLALSQLLLHQGKDCKAFMPLQGAQGAEWHQVFIQVPNLDTLL